MQVLGDQFACSSQNVSFHFLELTHTNLFEDVYKDMCVGRVWIFMAALFISKLASYVGAILEMNPPGHSQYVPTDDT